MIEEMKQNLEKDFKELCNYSYECDKRYKILKANTNSAKLTKCGYISVISLIPNLIIIGKFIPFESITFPVTLLATLATLSSIIIGYVGEKIITSKSTNEMRKFASVNTNESILQQSMYYEFEKEKAEITKDIYRKMYKNIETKERLINSTYDIDLFKYTRISENLSKEEINKKLEKIEKAYQERADQLTILVSQRFIKDKFNSYRDNKYRIPNIIMDIISTSFFTTFIIGIAFSLELNKFNTIVSFSDFLKLIGIMCSPSLIALYPTSKYFIKKDKDFRNVFKSLDSKLGDYSLSETRNHEYENKLNNLIESTISEMVELGIKQREATYLLNNFELDSSNQREKDFDWTQHLGRNSVENILNDKTPFPDKILRPIEFEIPKSQSDISWVEPYLDEDIEEDEDKTSTKQGDSKLVKKLTPQNKLKKKI